MTLYSSQIQIVHFLLTKFGRTFQMSVCLFCILLDFFDQQMGIGICGSFLLLSWRAKSYNGGCARTSSPPPPSQMDLTTPSAICAARHVHHYTLLVFFLFSLFLQDLILLFYLFSLEPLVYIRCIYYLPMFDHENFTDFVRYSNCRKKQTSHFCLCSSFFLPNILALFLFLFVIEKFLQKIVCLPMAIVAESLSFSLSSHSSQQVP